MTDLNGNVIQDANGHIGFPGFDGMEATVSLSFVAQMQEAGIPVTYAYVSDAHDGHGNAGNIHFAYGARRGRLRPAAARLRHRLPASSSTGWPRTGSTSRTRCSCSRSTRATTSPASRRRPRTATASRWPATTPACRRRDQRRPAPDDPHAVRRHTNFSVHSDDAPNVYVTGNPARTDLGHAQSRAGDGPAELAEPVHRPGRARHHGGAGRPDRDEDAAHDHGRPVPHADVHAVRRPRLVLLRDRRRQLPDAGRLRLHSGADEPELRVEPRRHPGRDRLDLGRLRRARASRTRRTYSASGPTTPTSGRPMLRCSACTTTTRPTAARSRRSRVRMRFRSACASTTRAWSASATPTSS